MQEYCNFDLLIHHSGDAYCARVVNAPSGEDAVNFALPFTADELAGFAGLAVDSFRQLVQAPTSGERTAPLDTQTFGKRLYQAVFAGGVHTALKRSLDAAERDGQGLRIRLRLASDVPELAALPWELLYLPDAGRFLALSAQTPLVRYLEVPEPVETLTVTPPLHVLVMVANPGDVTPLAVEEEWARVQEALGELQAGGLVRVERLPAARYAALQDRLRGDPVHIFHFIGHGYFDVSAGMGGLVFEDEAGKAALTNAVQIATLLHDHVSLRLALLNACEGARSGYLTPFAGVAQKLVQQGIPAVIAMQSPIGDRAAIALTHEFYQALATASPVDAALSEVRKALVGLGDEHAWAVPVLFSRSPDNRIFALPTGDARPVIERQPFEPETVMVAAGPFCMGSTPGIGVPDHETPAHTVTLPAYRIGKYPVINRQYAEFLKRVKLQEEPQHAGWFLREPPPDKLDQPVVGVSWQDAYAYCAWLSQATGRTYRLPTEAEWEKAARGTDGWRYPWGDEWVEGHCNVGGCDTMPVNAYPEGASPYGCLDMVGNVQEWTSTLWGCDLQRSDYPYPYEPQDGREDPDVVRRLHRVYHIHRGGSYRSQPGELRCSTRCAAEPNSAVRWRGFRVVMAIAENRDKAGTKGHRPAPFKP